MEPYFYYGLTINFKDLNTAYQRVRWMLEIFNDRSGDDRSFLLKDLIRQLKQTKWLMQNNVVMDELIPAAEHVLAFTSLNAETHKDTYFHPEGILAAKKVLKLMDEMKVDLKF